MDRITWEDTGLHDPNKLVLTPYRDTEERSVIFGHKSTVRPAPALVESQVRELVAWLQEWLAEDE